MKILFAPGHYVYSSEGYSEIAVTYRIVDGLARMHEGSKLITGSYASRAMDNLPYEVLEAQPTQTVWNVQAIGALKYNLRYFSMTERVLGEGGYGILHHVLPFAIGSTFNLSIMLGRTFGARSVIGPIQTPLTYQDADLLGAGKNKLRYSLQKAIMSIAKPIVGALSTLTLKRATRLVAVNQASKDMLVKRGVPLERIAIIPLGVDTQKYKPGPNRPSQVLVLITVGILTKRKGVEDILRAVAIAQAAKCSIRLIVVGDGPQLSPMKDLATELGVKERVEFTGYLHPTKVPDQFYRANTYVCMSKSEAFANVALEAMSSGLAVVSSPVGGFVDVIEQGKNGYVLKDFDHAELAQRLIRMCGELRTVLSMGDQAREKMVEEYDWEKKIIPRYEELYVELTGK